MDNKNQVKVSTFKQEFLQNNLQIENARKLALPAAIGNLFKIEDAEVVNGKTIYSVRTLNSAKMPIGSLLKISVKNTSTIFTKKMAYDSLTGSKSYVVRFENLCHWLMSTKTGLREGLSADNAELVNVQMKDVINFENSDRA